MTEYAIEVKDLTKSYGRTRVVDNLALHVPEGKVYGLLGRNGAGKTTTIRMIMGLVKPDAGEIFLHGRNVNAYRRWAARQIGAIIETPGFYSNLTARQNLLITASLFNAPLNRIHEVLEIVDLQGIDKKKVKELSLGMKQRLGIANALIHSPKILILDEPTNGLDPIGIKDMRLFLRKLSQSHGITTIISSHILSEIQKTVDFIGIVDNGKLIKETDIASFEVFSQTHIVLEAEPVDLAAAVLEKMNLLYEIDEQRFMVCCSRDMNEVLNRRLIGAGVRVFALTPASPSLEDQFIQTLWPA